MGLKIDHNNAGTTPLEEGWYEVYPTVFDATTAKSSGNKMAVFNYVVRDDVDQPGKGQQIRYDNFVETDRALWRVNAASKAAKLDDGAEYEDIYAWAREFQGRPVMVNIKINERGYPEVSAFRESKVGGIMKPEELEKFKGNTTNTNTSSQDPFAGGGATPVDISDDDLPF